MSSRLGHSSPTPTLLLYPGDQSAQHQALLAKIASVEKNLAKADEQARPAFELWSRDGATTNWSPLPRPIAAYDFDEVVTNRFLNQIDGSRTAALADNPTLVPGVFGKAVRFSGDNSVTAKGVGNFKRTDPFTVSFWIRPTELQPRAVLLHHSRAWTDSASRGYEVLLENSMPTFALIHFWPGNAAAVQSHLPVPTNEWSHLTLTYDGSSRASGMRIYLNGSLLKTKVLRDNLYRDIQHRSEWGDAEAGGVDLTLAGRFRDSGFRNGEMDDLKVFDIALTAGEVRRLHARGGRERAPEESERFETYVQRVDEQHKQLAQELRKLREEENELVNSVKEIMVMKELTERRQTYLLKRGAYDAPGDPVEPGVPERIMPMPPEFPKNRLGLAQWMVHPKNPLTARVAVNRIWKLHFGRGLVLTVEDFGAQGQLPSHPELLDWLAKRFMDSGWDRKALHRLIVTSATYRQTSQGSADSFAKDPENRWYSRGPKHRLSAEQIRDHALAVSGLLVTKMGGPSVKPYQPAGVWEEAGTGKSYSQDKGEKLYRRSLYTFWRRTAPPPSMLSFDATSREVCTAKREVTSTPLQALVLLNDVQFIEAARVLAERLMTQYPADVPARIRDAFRSLTSRLPDGRETQVLEQLLSEQLEFYRSQPESAEKLLAQGERKPNKDLNAVELAATTLLVSTLMNHDEFVIKR